MNYSQSFKHDIVPDATTDSINDSFDPSLSSILEQPTETGPSYNKFQPINLTKRDK